MTRGIARTVRAALAAIILLVSAASAWAQGYSVTAAEGRLEARPAGARPVEIDSSRADRATQAVWLPFEFRYYGWPIRSLLLSAHGCLFPGDAKGLGDPSDPAAPHGQDAASGAFPYRAGAAAADGVIAPLWTKFQGVGDGSPACGHVFTWMAGEAPERRFVVSWEDVSLGADARVTVQVQLCEGTGRIVFAYAGDPAAFTASGVKRVCGFDEPGGDRFNSPLPGGAAISGWPGSDVVFEPRTVLFNSPLAPKAGTDAAWQEIQRESLTAPGSAKGACYVAKGRGWFFVPDRVRREKALAAEDAATFGATGDPVRWVKQVLDAKAILVPKDGGDAVRVWFRIVEWFTVDAQGLAGPDDHVWNLRRMLRMAFPDDDPRSRIEGYCAWRGMVSARLSVVKLFDADQRSDAGPQFDTNRKNEYVLWCARFRTGTRGRLGPDEAPRAGWTRFALQDENLGAEAPQHADAGDLREVRDPNYVDGGYAYTIRGNGFVPGWEVLPTAPRAALSDEKFEDDPAPAGVTTPR